MTPNGGVVLYAVGFVFWDVLLLDYYAADAGAAAVGLRETQVLWAILLGTLVYGGLITYLVGQQSGAATTGGGLKAGALAGFFLWAAADLIYFGFLDLWSLKIVSLDVGLEIVRGAIGGAVVTLVLSKVPD